MKLVVITGANGFIGNQLAEFFLSCNIKVLGIDIDRQQAATHPLYDYIQKDLMTDNEDIIPLCHSADLLYHTAWIGVHPSQRQNYELQLQNTTLHIKVLELSKKAEIKKIICLGSASEFSGYDIPIHPYLAFRPVDGYGAAKAACHTLCKTWAQTNNLSLTWTIISSIYGPGRDDNNVLSYAIRSLLKKDSPYFTALEQRWNYIYIYDLLSALYLVGYKGKDNVDYCIGSTENFPLSHYVEQIHQIIAPEVSLGIGEIPYKSNKIDNSIMDISALIEDTGFVPKTTFSDGINKTIMYFKELIDKDD